MIYDVQLAWWNLRARPLQTLIPVLIMGLAIGLSIAVLAMSSGFRRGIVQASDPFGVLVVGPKGDSQQLVLNTILLQGDPLGVIPFEIYEALADDARARLVVPLAKSDNIGGAPIIGTDENFFALRPDLMSPPAFQLAAGRLFDAEGEAVLGHRAAQALSLNIGDHFHPAHGETAGLEDDVHDDHLFTVVGILQPSGTAYDGAVYTNVESVWHTHAEEEGADEADHAEGDEHHGELTAILVQPAGFADANLIWQEFYSGTAAQAVFPGQALGGLFDLLNEGVRILTMVGYLVLAIAGLTVFLSMYAGILSRERDIAIMRSVGSRRANIFRVVLLETLSMAVLGALLGRLIGYLTASALGAAFTAQSAIPMPISYLTELEPLLWLMTLGVGAAAGIIPALLAYRVDVVEKLAPA